MAWPTPSDYQDAVQNPRSVFSDPRLQAAQVALGPLGLPKVASGNYASVYELRAGSQRWAVRCFNRQVPDAQRRYRTIDEHLNRHPLPWLVGFDFLNEGIRVRGRWHPIVVMDWVEGVTLSRYLEKRFRDGAALRALADQWPPMLADLRAAQIAHGDLQHGNILVAQERFQLVDYDNLFVPAFQGERSPELGRLHYQHPGRTADDFDLDIANFSALVIYLSLRALAADPSLWQAYNGENLVLTADDYKRPSNSATLAQMRRSPDPEVGRLAQELARCAALPVSQVPPLEAALTTAGITPTRSTAARPSPTIPPAGSRPDWLEGATPDPLRPPPPQQRRPRRPAPAPAPPPTAGGWWDLSGPTPAPPQTQPQQRRPRRPGGLAGRRRQPPASPGAGTATLPRPAPVPTAAPAGCLATLVRSCVMALLMLGLLVGGAGWWAYQNWDRIGPIVGVPPLTMPRSPADERPTPDRLPPATEPPADPAPAPERQPPNTVPRTSPMRPEAEPPGPPGPPSRAQPQEAPAAPETPPTRSEPGQPPAAPPGPATSTPTRPTSPPGAATGTQPKPAPASPPRSLELLTQATTRLQAGDPDGAIEALAAARKAGLRLEQEDVAKRYFATVAEARYRAGQYLLSIGAFRQALRLDPENERLRAMLRDALGRLGRRREGSAAGL